ncbi:Putative ilvBH operon leader peptide [Deinococcus deserti]|uniref:Putative ilvBH operon leader peptide n=1 Tax=Deinococcus deserti (strain DSM 17065 / CIP 109153 / LMG 22923 / VCD115) TaxID=546414 RepID=X5H5J3_DEIDV|nr:putative ilvBH operon leader peptide [Deinococcus deserti VCD115]
MSANLVVVILSIGGVRG